MALSTTQSIWRSGGGDQTRTAYCGSGVMTAEFYIPNAALSANVKVSSAVGAPNLILPEGAVVLSIAILNTGTGTVHIGTTGLNSGVTAPTSIADGIGVTSVITHTIGVDMPGTTVPEISYVVSSDETGGGGTVGGYITYFVRDPLVGQQNV